MTWSKFWIALGLAVALPAVPAAAADLTIHVRNVQPAGGILRLGLYDAARYPDDDSKPVASADVPAVAGETVVTLHGVAPGSYAIQTFQDINSNDKMDQSWIGLPLEPFGFSQDAKPFLSKPGFDEVRFTLAAGETALVIHLQNSIRNSSVNKARDAIRTRQRK